MKRTYNAPSVNELMLRLEERVALQLCPTRTTTPGFFYMGPGPSDYSDLLCGIHTQGDDPDKCLHDVVSPNS